MKISNIQTGCSALVQHTTISGGFFFSPSQAIYLLYRYLMITVSESTKEVCQWYYAKLYEDGKLLDLKNLNIVKLIDNFDATYDYITNNDSVFYFRTNLKAPNAKIIKLDITKAKQNGQISFDEVF